MLNDYPAGTSFGSISVTGSDIFNFNGNALTLTGGLSSTGGAGNGCVIKFAITAQGSQTFTSLNTVLIQAPLTVNGGTLTFAGNGSFLVEAAVGGSGSILRAADGGTYFDIANTYTGSTTVTGGTLQVQSVSGLGSTLFGTTVTGGTLQVTATGTIAGEALSISGTPFSNMGSLDVQGNVTWTGPVTVAGNTTIRVGSGSMLTLNNLQGTSELRLRGGTTALAHGPTGFSGSIVMPAGATILRMDADNALSVSPPLDIASGSTLNVNGHNVTIGRLSGAGSVSLPAGSVLQIDPNSLGAFTGTISGPGTIAIVGSGAPFEQHLTGAGVAHTG